MRVISFDVGIKNMAYCILEIEVNTPLKIIEWKTINLMNEEDITKPTLFICSCNNKPKKGIVSKCSRKALYMKSFNSTNITTPISFTPTISHSSTNICYFCEKHAKETTEYIIPDKAYNSTSLKKLTIEELKELCNKYLITLSLENSHKKTKIIEILSAFFKEKSFEVVKYKKQKTSKETDLISIGRNMRDELNNIYEFDKITHVIIENQISTLAARMNSIQGMLVQYFIMRKEDSSINIEFISSTNKLKGLPPIPEEKNNSNNLFISENVIQEKTTHSTQPCVKNNTKYKEHKKNGLYHCSMFLENNSILKEWKRVLDTKKKDDYADCFLQGVWYIKNVGFFKQNINYQLS